MIRNEVVGWEWFERDHWSPLAQQEQGDPDIAAAFARCFSSPDGERVLRHLRRHTSERALGPEAADSLLRHLEGQRYLMALITGLIEQGTAAR